VPALVKLLLAVLAAVGLTWWSWRGRLESPLAFTAALCRAAGLLALLLLLLDPGIGTRGLTRRPIVLLDNSVSMHATGGQAAAAATLAASLGDTATFGEVAPGEPGGRTTLADALGGAMTSGRPVVVVTDGEVADHDAIAPELLAQTTVRLLPRARGADIALIDVRGPTRLAVGDSLWLEVEGYRQAGAADTSAVEVREGGTVLARGTLRFGTGDRTRVRLEAALPAGMRGDHWLEVVRAGAVDAEPIDDTRWWLLSVTPAPGIVVIASAPDWDSRALYRTIKDVANAPVRGFVQIESGQWRRMDDLRKVPSADVVAAARVADLVAVRGDPLPWRTAGRARLLWPPSDQAGDWYVNQAGVSPVAGAFAGVDADSLPPAVAVRRVDADSLHGWIGAVARQGRRGATVPVIAGRNGPNGRTVLIGADGLYRWAFRGGASDQLWRTLIATATSWLLASPEVEGARARPVLPVTQRGRAARFRWSGTAAPAPLPVTLSGQGAPRLDTLRFDGNGEASLFLPPGRYHYSLGGGGEGTLGVEPFSDEIVPGAITLKDQAATALPPSPRRSLRELLPLFLLALAGFGSEWMLRRRLGLR
jgi:hypothetical protein